MHPAISNYTDRCVLLFMTMPIRTPKLIARNRMTVIQIFQPIFKEITLAYSDESAKCQNNTILKKELRYICTFELPARYKCLFS